MLYPTPCFSRVNPTAPCCGGVSQPKEKKETFPKNGCTLHPICQVASSLDMASVNLTVLPQSLNN
eukprot:gnl/Chilomastix_caulleri/8570.p2 GENE.gnl/Chilomastix_caulleri/8570~~gnl/Chilomastix_caulleri/8570.p2  ORF type:complete len:65 (-),score=1.68 gnl/Chilomastix_caulleri/8570:115-309(-)